MKFQPISILKNLSMKEYVKTYMNKYHISYKKIKMRIKGFVRSN